MYLHLGQDTVITTETVIGIFDMDECTVSKKTRDYLTAAEKRGRVVNVSFELPKSFVVCEKNGKMASFSPVNLEEMAKHIENQGERRLEI